MEDFINRIGTDRHKYKLEFVLRKIKFSKELTGSIYVSIRRGKHKMDSQPVSMNAERQCNLGKQILTFPGITLFFDSSANRYQKKPGEMKIFSVSSNGDKKLLGIVLFNVDDFANAQRSGKSEESSKIKAEVSQVPQKLKMRAELEYSVFVKFIGEGSETDNSVRDDKLRNQSPLDKLKNFFFGNDAQKPKPPSPKKTQLTNSKTSRNKPSEVEPQDIELEDVPVRKMRSTDKKKNDEKVKTRKKEKRVEKEDEVQEQQDLFNFTKEPIKSKVKDNSSESEQLEEKQEQKKTEKQDKSKRSDVSKRTAEKVKEDNRNGQSDRHIQQRQGRPPKNIVKQQERDNFTQYQQKSRKRSDYNKSEPIHNAQNEESDVNVYFDDPKTFAHLQQPPKKFDKVKIPKTPSIRQQVDSQGDEKSSEVTPKEKIQVIPSPQRKVKENSISLSSKEMIKEKKKKREDPILKEEIITTEKKEEKEQVKVKIQQQTKDLFTNFQEPVSKRGDKALSYSAKKSKQGEQQVFLKEQLERKEQQLIELSNKLRKYGQIELKLKDQEASKKAAERTIGDLKERNARLEQQLKRTKEENESLRSEKQNQSSFFRETQNHYLNNSEDVSLQEENKRLQREKNEALVALTKEKQRQKKEAKEFREQLEKERLKFKELENVSKIDLKKLKDEMSKITGHLQSTKDKLKEKTLENDTLLQENKVLNGLVIELKEKLASLKFKICEKLNEANENGQAELMEVLTDLSEDI